MSNPLTVKKILLRPSLLFFGLSWLFIGAVSSLDSVFTIAFRENLELNEQNPLARFIMYADNWSVARFVGLKMFGTIFVLGFLVWLYHRKSVIAYFVTFILAFLQGLLLVYFLQ